MTTHTTPTIWIAGKEQRFVDSYLQRIAPFAESHELSESELERSASRILHNVASRSTAWFLVTAPERWTYELISLARKCREFNSGFQCLVVADWESLSDGERMAWPEGTIFVPTHALSTTIIDRLRAETHANRIATHRRRQIERLQRRSA